MLIELSKNMTPVERHIVQKISSDPNFFLKSDITYFANSINVSPSALSRLAKKLDLNGYSQLKMLVLQKTLAASKIDALPERANDHFRDVVNIYHGVVNNVAKIQNKQIKKIVHDLKEAQNIIAYGNGSSNLAASHLANYLMFNGFQANSFKDFHKVLLFLQANKDSMLIIFSKEIQSMEVKFLIQIASKYNLKFWLITANLENIVHLLNNTIAFNAINHQFKGVSISSKIGMLLIIDMIIWEMNINNQQKEEAKLLEEWKIFKN